MREGGSSHQGMQWGWGEIIRAGVCLEIKPTRFPDGLDMESKGSRMTPRSGT